MIYSYIIIIIIIQLISVFALYSSIYDIFSVSCISKCLTFQQQYSPHEQADVKWLLSKLFVISFVFDSQSK